MTTQTRDHPSNRLYRGEARNFEHACTLAVAAAQAERRTAADLDHAFGALPAEERIDVHLERYEAAALTARGIYAGEMAELRPRLVAKLRAAGLNDWADAFEREDYRNLAI